MIMVDKTVMTDKEKVRRTLPLETQALYLAQEAALYLDDNRPLPVHILAVEPGSELGRMIAKCLAHLTGTEVENGLPATR